MIRKISTRVFCQETKFMEADLAGRRPLLRLPCFDDHGVDDDNDHIPMMTMSILIIMMTMTTTLQDEAL